MQLREVYSQNPLKHKNDSMCLKPVDISPTRRCCFQLRQIYCRLRMQSWSW